MTPSRSSTAWDWISLSVASGSMTSETVRASATSKSSHSGAFQRATHPRYSPRTTATVASSSLTTGTRNAFIPCDPSPTRVRRGRIERRYASGQDRTTRMPQAQASAQRMRQPHARRSK
eukprot:1238602-Rhodomonas_salina.1